MSSNAREDGKFISESCEVFAFGSNSSSQLAMGSTEKFHKATLMQHMANVQVVCTYMHAYIILGDLPNNDCKCNFSLSVLHVCASVEAKRTLNDITTVAVLIYMYF